MNAPLWLPGVTRLPPTNQSPIPLGLQGSGKRLFTWHTFEAPYSYSPDGIAAMRYLHSQGSTAHFVYHPITGALVQALPANVGARTLQASAPSRHTNAYGDEHMQVEVIAYANRPWTLDLTEAGRIALQRLMDFLRSRGIPDQWAWTDMVRPPATYAEANRPGSRGQPHRSGHATHSRWWANTHWDPGGIEQPWVIAPPTPAPTPPKPDPDVALAQDTLNDLMGTDLDVDGFWGPLTEAAAKDYATEFGYTGRVTDLAALNTHLEDTMSRLDVIESKVDAALKAAEAAAADAASAPRRTAEYAYPHPRTGERTQMAAYPAFANDRAAAAAQMAGQAVAEAAALRGGVEALVAAVSSSHGLDTAAITKAVEDGVAAAVSRVEADVRLVLAATDTEQED